MSIPGKRAGKRGRAGGTAEHAEGPPASARQPGQSDNRRRLWSLPSVPWDPVTRGEEPWPGPCLCVPVQSVLSPLSPGCRWWLFYLRPSCLYLLKPDSEGQQE